YFVMLCSPSGPDAVRLIRPFCQQARRTRYPSGRQPLTRETCGHPSVRPHGVALGSSRRSQHQDESGGAVLLVILPSCCVLLCSIRSTGGLRAITRKRF